MYSIDHLSCLLMCMGLMKRLNAGAITLIRYVNIMNLRKVQMQLVSRNQPVDVLSVLQTL